MAQYRFIVELVGGTGSITINGIPRTGGWYYEEGTNLTITITLDTGFSAVQWFISPDYTTPISSALSFVYVMPPADTKIRAEIDGNYTPIDDYGTKYTFNKLNIFGVPFKVEIAQFGFGGLPEERLIENAIFGFGSRGADIVKERIVLSSVDLFLVANATTLNYDDLLTGDNRKFRTRLFILGSVTPFFTGYISPSQMTREIMDFDYQLRLTALDGMSSLNSFYSVPQHWPNSFVLSSALVGMLNQTFINKRNLKASCSVWETRANLSLFSMEQLVLAESCIYKDGDDADFVDGVRVVNETLKLDESIKRATAPFVGRIFLWNDIFYFARLEDYDLNPITYHTVDPTGATTGSASLPNSNSFPCLNGTTEDGFPEEEKSIAYTQFVASLNLGVLKESTQSAVIEYVFDLDDWVFSSPVSPYPSTYFLARWQYTRARMAGQPDDYPDGEIALVQYRSDATAEGCQIWTTTTVAGTADPNISFISCATDRTGGDLTIVRDTANKFSVTFEFMVLRVRSGPTNVATNHTVGVQIRVGSSYLFRDTPTTFDWTLTPTVMEFPVPSAATFNIVEIKDVTVPEDGILTVSLYQLILKSGTRHQFALIYKNFKLDITKNEALTLQSVKVMGITDIGYNSVYDEYETYYGDTETAQSTSAMLLNQPLAVPPYPFTDAWTRNGVESLKLLQIVVQEVGNRKGKPQSQVFGTTATMPDPTLAYTFLGKRWIISYLRYNVYKDEWAVEMTQL